METNRCNTWQDVWAKYPVPDRILQIMNEMRDFWVANSRETESVVRLGCNGNIMQRIWSDVSAEKTFLEMFDAFMADLLTNFTPAECASYMGLAYNENGGFHFSTASSNISYTKNYAKMATNCWPIFRDGGFNL